MSKLIGVIAEDESDIEVIKEFIIKINSNKSFSFKKFTGGGCGKVMRKCNDWAHLLHARGCRILILVHDLDRNNHQILRQKIEKAINPCPINPYFISIPVEEIEAWLLADPMAIKTTFKLKVIPKISHLPERINSPKEYIENLILKLSSNSKIYLNTKHNLAIAKNVSIKTIRQKSPSFNEFYQFVTNNL